VKHRALLTGLIALFLIAGNLIIDRWPNTLFYGDSNGYYLHLLAFFVHQDVGDYDATIQAMREINPASPDPRTDKWGMRKTPRGRYYIKYTLGVPVMEAPFFLLAHAYAKMSPKYEANGWSRPYLLLVGFASIFYVIWGLYLLAGLLSRYFAAPVVWLICLALVLATNLFYHTNYVIMSHGFLFFQHCLLIWLSVRLWEQPKLGRFVAVGASLGLITLTRVPEIVAALVPLLWGVDSWETFKLRIRWLLRQYNYVLAGLLGFILVFGLQIYYWYYVSGQLVFNPYEGETFDFTNPRFFKGFFHFKNGWLLYTPIMTFAIFGLFVLRRFTKIPFWSVVAFFALQAYIHYAYYAWTFFPGLGQRPMVETYPLLSFPLAAAFAYFWSKKTTIWLPAVLVICCSVLNLFQTWQMREGVIWSERHNAAFYWETFGTMRSTLNSLRAFDAGELQPTEEEVAPVRVVQQTSFEDLTLFTDSLLRSTFVHRGQYAIYPTGEYFTLSEGLVADLLEADWLKVAIWAYMDEVDQIYHRDAAMNLRLEFFDEQGKRRKEYNIKVSAYLGNSTYSIWTAGMPNVWGEASFYARIPRRASAAWSYRVSLVNPAGQGLYLDDFLLTLYKKH